MTQQLMKKLVPKSVRNLRHLWYAWRGTQVYGRPDQEMLVIGVTGTSGKSSTSFFLRQLLEFLGHSVGALSTIEFYIDKKQKINDQKMTMLGKMAIPRYLKQMADAGTEIAIVEVTSEGIVQHRHRFINFDIAVLTNLYPEHIESHGSFENYRAAKRKLFTYTAAQKRKVLKGKTIEKSIVLNKNIVDAPVFCVPHIEQIYAFGDTKTSYLAKANITEDISVTDIKTSPLGISFTLQDTNLQTNIVGEHNAYNIAAAAAVARALSIEWSDILAAIPKLGNAPGRLEFIKEAEKFGFSVIVDYAFEPVAIQALYDTVAHMDKKRIIHVCGATGGGRDQARREPIGALAGAQADIVIVTNEDPYDEDPIHIIDMVAQGAIAKGKKLGENLYKIEDRAQAIEKAISLAQAGDIILVTGKGSEQGICIAHGDMIPWDDRTAVRNALSKRKK